MQSTEDIEKSCEAFEEFAPSSDGGNGRFQGSFECVGENENANEGNGKGKKGKDDEDAGALFGVSAPVVLAVAGGALEVAAVVAGSGIYSLPGAGRPAEAASARRG